MVSPLAAIRRRLMLLIGRAVIAAVRADGGRVELDLGQLEDEEPRDVELAEPWGFTSIPLPGAEALTLSVMGERGQRVAISMGDRRHRPRDGQPGESILFDDQGQRIGVRRDRLELVTPMKLVIEAGEIEIAAGSLTIGGKAVATIDDLVEIGSGSSAGGWPIVTGVGAR